MSTQQTSEANLRTCPYCSEPILVDARKCRYCGEWLEERAAPPEPAAGMTLADPGGVRVREETPVGTNPVPRTNGLAVASLVLALCGAIVGAIPALILGYRARKQIRESDGSQRGEGLAVAGITLGWIETGVLAILAVILISLAVPTAGEKAQHDAEAASRSWANAEFAYFAQHGQFTVNIAELRALGARTVSPGDWVTVESANAQRFCVDGVINYQNDYGSESYVHFAEAHLTNDQAGRYWTWYNVQCKDLIQYGKFS